MFFKKVCSIVTSIALLHTQTVYASGIEVDSRASNNHKPTLENAQNGVPIVNIVNPNSSGLSHNKFKNYNVSKQGLILNNSQAVTKTQLAGYIDRNPNLRANATVILNEVTGTNKSLLKGYTEVAGSSAHVIVANPNGIFVNGGGFINTPKVTLTTGNPLFNGNTLHGFNVKSGGIFIEGEGFNATNIDKVNLYSKALELNAKIYAKDLNIVTGENNITLDGRVNSNGVNGQGVSIDSSYLGGIYADIITLASSDKGVGINLPPEVIAQKDLTINSEGDIVLAKTISQKNMSVNSNNGNITSNDNVSGDKIKLDSKQDIIVKKDSVIEADSTLEIVANRIENKGKLHTVSKNSELKLNTTNSIINQGDIYSNNHLTLSADEKIINSKNIGAKNITIDSKKDLIVDANGIIEANNNLLTKANNLENSGEIRAVSDSSIVSLEVEEKILNDNIIYSKNDIVISTNELENNKLIQADDDIKADITKLANNLDGTVYAKDSLELKSKDIVNSGVITADTLDIETKTITNKGALYSKKDMTITADTFTNEEMIRSNEEINLLIENDLTNKKTGVIYADGNINIAANEEKEKINTVTNKGLIQSHQDINITAKTLNNTADAPVFTPNSASSTRTVSRGGSKNYDIVTTTVTTQILTVATDPALMLAEGDITIDVDTLNNYYSLISSDKDIILNANTANNVGKVALTTTSTVTKQYRKEKYCVKRRCGKCRKHKSRAAYRGTYTSTQTSKIPIVNFGIQAKRSITGNVVTLNNVNSGQDILTQQEIVQKQDEINTVAVNSVNFQDSITLLDDNNEQINLTLSEIENMQEKIEAVQTQEEFTTFKTDLGSMKTALKESIDKDQESINTIEAVIDYSKSLASTPTLDKEIKTLESSLVKLQNNLEENKTNLENLENIDNALNQKEDIGGQKQALIDIDKEIKTTVSSNTAVIKEIESDSVTPIVDEFEKRYDILNNDLQTTLNKQQNTKQTVISNQDGIYQTTNTPQLKAVNNIIVNNSKNVVAKLTLPKNRFGLFRVSSNPKHTYLIESNPLYTNYKTFISSDYMMGKLNYDPTKTIKRLGDGMYETTLIRNSIINLSGQRYLKGYDSDLAQYKGLMDNAIEVQKDLKLSFGVTLSKDQINNLTKDIVWMEEKVVEGNRVLVPVVYLASLEADNLKDGAQIIAGENIALKTTGTLQNQGRVEAKKDLVLLSNNLQNHGGTIEAKNDALLQSEHNIDNISGDIKAGNDLKLNAKGDINLGVNLNQKTYNHRKGYYQTTYKGKDASVQAGGDLILNADKNVKVTASHIKAGKDATIIANKGDISLNTIGLKEKFFFKVKGGKYAGDSLKNTGSSIAANNLSLVTNNNINIKGSNIQVNEKADIYAKNINISSAADSSYSKYKSSIKGYKVKKIKQATQNISSLLQAKNVKVDTNSLTLVASKIKANEAQITADIVNLISSKDSEYYSKSSENKGFFTKTVKSKGYIKEKARAATIEVNDKLIVNNKDITKQLSTENIIKILSSEGKLTHEQINLVKTVLNNKDWNEKHTSMSGLGALVVAVVVTVLTAGAGTAIVGAGATAATTTATAAATTAATTASVQAAVVQSLVTSIANQAVTSAITGNSFKLDGEALLKGAVSAGVMSYAGSMIDSSLGLENVKVADMSYTEQFQQSASNTLVRSAVDSAVYGTDFKDNLVFNAVNAVGAKASNIIGENYKEGNLNYFSHKLAHAATGAVTAELMGRDGASGAIGAVAGEVIGEGVTNQLSHNGLTSNELKTVRLSSQVGGILSAKALGKDAKTAGNSAKVAVDNNTIYTYNGKVVATDKVNNGKVVELTKKEYLSQSYMQNPYNVLYGDPNEIAIVPQEDLSKYANVYNLYNQEDFNRLRETTDMKYNNINSKTDVVFMNGMGNDYIDALTSQSTIEQDFPKSNVGVVNNQTGKTLGIVEDIFEWKPNYLTTKDVLTAHQLQQISPNSTVITHSAGNEDIFKANQINALVDTKTPYKLISVGSPKSATDLKESLNTVGATFVKQINHTNDPVANGWLNEDANYKFNLKEPFKHSFETYFPYVKQELGKRDE